MAVDKELLDILICPNCRGEVEYRPDEEVIVCVGQCGLRYPVRDDIPVMLIDEAEKPAGRSARPDGTSTTPPRCRPPTRRACSASSRGSAGSSSGDSIWGARPPETPGRNRRVPWWCAGWAARASPATSPVRSWGAAS